MPSVGRHDFKLARRCQCDRLSEDAARANERVADILVVRESERQELIGLDCAEVKPVDIGATNGAADGLRGTGLPGLVVRLEVVVARRICGYLRGGQFVLVDLVWPRQ